MENCLVTKLKAVVNNDRLLKDGEMLFQFEAAGQMQVKNSSGCNLRIITSGVTFADSGEQTRAVGLFDNTFSVTGRCEIIMTNKRTQTRFWEYSGGVACNLSDFKLSANLERLYTVSGRTVGNLSDLSSLSELIGLRVCSPLVVGTTNDIKSNALVELLLSDQGSAGSVLHTSLTGAVSNLVTNNPNLETVGLDSTDVTGSITDFGALRNTLANLYIRNTSINGSANALFDAMYNSGNGRTSGTLKLYAQGSSVKYNGEDITAPMTVTFSASGWSIS